MIVSKVPGTDSAALSRHPERSVTSERPVAYIMSRFPLLTETFILREMLDLERQGVALKVFPLLRAEVSVRHDEVERLRAEVHYTPFLSTPIVAANLTFLRRDPRRYLRLLWRVLKGNWGSANLFVGALGIFPKSVYFARLAEDMGVGHVHAHYATHPALSALIISELTGIGYSFTAHAHDIFLEQRMLAEKVRGARFVAAISRYNKDFLLRLAPEVSPDKIEVVHCGIELEKYGASSARPSRSPQSSVDTITAICVASLQPYKGLSYLIRACVQVVRQVPNFRCSIIGQGADRAELESLIHELGLDDTVHLLGGLPQHEVAKLLGDAEIFVLPSIVAPSGQMEGIPVALMEAMASRLPVVSTRLSGIPELIDDGVNGLLVAPADESALADAIVAVAGASELRRRMGERGREKVAAEFELRGNVEFLQALFAKAANETESERHAAPFQAIEADASCVDPEIVEWVSRQISPSGDAGTDIVFKRLGGGADSQVFEVVNTSNDGLQTGLILKLHRPGRVPPAERVETGKEDAENDFHALSLLWRAFSQDSTHLAVPRPVAFSPEHAAVLMEKRPGVGLGRASRWARFRHAQREALPGWFSACGEWLAVFQRATKSDGDPRPVLERLEREFHSDLELCRRRGLDADLITAAAQRFESHKDAAFDGALGLVGRHCDFAPYNVLVSGNQVSVIDFEGLQPGLVYEDLCYFLSMHEVTPPYHLGRGSIAALSEAFLHGYEGHMPLDRDALHFFMVLSMVKVMAHTPVLRAQATWLADLKRRQRLRFYRGWFREKLS